MGSSDDVYYVPEEHVQWILRDEDSDVTPTIEEEEEMSMFITPEMVDQPTTPKVSQPKQKSSKQRIKEQLQSRYEQQESKRAPKVQIDQKATLYLWISGITIAFIASAFVSYNGITAVAEFVGLTQTWMSSLFFFFIEVMYLLFLVAYLILSSRVQENGQKERTFGAILGMIAFGGVAVLANGFHTFDYWNYDFTEPRLWAGTILSVSAPLAIISASKMASRVVFAKALMA
jgi:hypothetical protein